MIKHSAIISIIAACSFSAFIKESRAKDLIREYHPVSPRGEIYPDSYSDTGHVRLVRNKNDSQGDNSTKKIYNIEVEAVYNKVIQLNVSWQKSDEDGWPASYDFKIFPNSTHPPCNSQTHYETYDKHKDLTNVLLPPYPPKNVFEIYPECKYEVSVIPKPTFDLKNVQKLIYEVPECVGKICSCRNLKPQLNRLNVTANLEYLNISWTYNNSLEDVNNITHISFGYRQAPVVPDSLVPFLKVPVKYYLSPNSTFFHIKVDNGSFRSGMDYELKAYFTNSYNCKTYINTTFQILPQLKLEPQRRIRAFGSWLELTLSLALLSFILLFVIYIFRRNKMVIKEILRNPTSIRRNRTHTNINQSCFSSIKQQEERSCLYIEKEIYEGSVDQYEFPRARIRLIESIGGGAFGEVFSAEALGIQGKAGYTLIAVKKLRDPAPPQEIANFGAEIAILKKVGRHPNIIALLGCCKLQEPYMMLMELAAGGDLYGYLVALRNQWDHPNENSDGSYILPNAAGAVKDRLNSEAATEYTTIESGTPSPTEVFAKLKMECKLDHNELQRFALQIAKAMAYLEKLSITHRDLAARNVLMDEYKNLKVSDFGLSRAGPYINSKSGKLPLRWMAIESIRNNFYDNKSDVWSFGVVLWEIGTLGAFPYGKTRDGMVLFSLLKGERLERPEICTDELYNLMVRCWSRDSRWRPAFSELVQILESKEKRVYVDFAQLNPCYVFPNKESHF